MQMVYSTGGVLGFMQQKGFEKNSEIYGLSATGGTGPWSINVHLYVCRLCINFHDLCASLLGDIRPFFMLLTFISCFVIDSLTI